MAFSVVYFQFTHHWGRPHYVWDEYLYSVLEEVKIRMTVCVTDGRIAINSTICLLNIHTAEGFGI